MELLERLLKDEIKARFKTNVVQIARFSELLQQALTRYRNRAIETAQVVEELIAMAKDFNEAAGRGERLGLGADELAFYDALATNESAVRELGDAALRARLRVKIKTLLRRFKYPPDRQDAATDKVLEQAETLSQEWMIA